jgi:hypothetical protein
MYLFLQLRELAEDEIPRRKETAGLGKLGRS